MNNIIERLAYRIGEGFQASSLINAEDKTNIFHRAVITHESSDLSFINGLISTGLRGSALIDGGKVIGNYNQLLTASRQHLPLVVNTNSRLVGKSKYSIANNFSNINAIHQAGCFQFVASSPQDDVYFTLLAHRIAELSLIPGVVISDYDQSETEVNIPNDSLINRFLGNPDDHIQCPTPAQEIIFGKTRRRIPNWISTDSPVMLGSKKNEEAISRENAASQKYFYDHLPQLISQAFQEFRNVFGVDISQVKVKGDSSNYAVISLNSIVSDLFDQLPKEKQKARVIAINQLHPFPSSEITRLLKGAKAITILENDYGLGSKNSPFYYEIIESLKGLNLTIYSGKYGSAIDSDSLYASIDHMVTNQSRTSYHLGVEFTKKSSNYPKHEVLLQEIDKKYPEIASSSVLSEKSVISDNSFIQDEIPLAIRMYHDKGPKYSQLSRFYDNTAFFYAHSEESELVADPFTAVPVIPSVSASFFNQSIKREQIPILDTNKCTGCGDCFIQCPHSALPPIAIGIEQLLNAGINIVSSKGVIVTRLTPMVKNLAKLSVGFIKENVIKSIEDFLPQAFDSLITQMKLDGEKLETAQKELALVLNAVTDLPLVATDQLFNTPESIEAGSGDLFSLIVNPVACTGCSICAQSCNENALLMESQTEENLELVKRQFKIWEQLPDTSGDTIGRLHHDKDYNSLAAMLLSRSYYMTISGANNSENNNPYKTLLHIITATTESVVQPKIVGQIRLIDELIESVSENVHKKLSNALPKDNLDSLSKSLKNTQGQKLFIQDVVNQLAKNDYGKLLDHEDLRRKTELVEALKNLKWALTEGSSGVGRSRYSVLLAGSSSMDWAKEYPSNNFTSPVVIHWNGSAPDQMLGLFYGQLRFLLDNIKLMRRANLESKDKYDPSVHDQEISALSWGDLTVEEKQLIPPILLIAERDDLNESGWSSLNKILAGKYPLKVFLLDHVASPNQSPIEALVQTNAGIFSTISLKNAYVFQGGMGNMNHLFDGLMDGLDRTYPALFNLYATSLEKHGVNQIDWTPFASLALNSRTFPSLRYDPGEKSDFLSGAISLEGNQASNEDWVNELINLSESETIDYKICWADWAFIQREWKEEFTQVVANENQLMVPEYIRLEKNARKGKVPVVARADAQGLKYYQVTDKVVEVTEAVLSNWNTLQEIAGLLTEFPLKLKVAVTKELSKKYEQEAAEMKLQYENQLKEQEAAQTEILRKQLKDKLIMLSNMAKN